MISTKENGASANRVHFERGRHAKEIQLQLRSILRPTASLTNLASDILKQWAVTAVTWYIAHGLISKCVDQREKTSD